MRTQSAQFGLVCCVQFQDNWRSMVLVCCTLFKSILCSLALFAIRKTALPEHWQLYLCFLFSHALTGLQYAHLTRLTRHWIIRKNWILLQTMGTLYHDSDVPMLEELQRFDLSVHFRSCAILQPLSSAVKMGCIRRFCALNPLFTRSDPMRICLYAIICVIIRFKSLFVLVNQSINRIIRNDSSGILWLFTVFCGCWYELLGFLLNLLC